jgi:magnesium transporter
MSRDESELIRQGTHIYLRDVYDHVIQLNDTIESYRDLLGGLLDLHMSIVSNRMNEVMKVLTIIATIFIPITFIAGIYGMNFKNMPELEWPWGYGFAWLVIGVITVCMILFFRKKKWL